MSNEAMWASFKAKEDAFDRLIVPAMKLTEVEISKTTNIAKVWGSHFGATGIDPQHLFIYFVLPTRVDVMYLKESSGWIDIKFNLLKQLELNGYPVSALREGWLGLFSEQECKEETNGNWYYFFK